MTPTPPTEIPPPFLPGSCGRIRQCALNGASQRRSGRRVQIPPSPLEDAWFRRGGRGPAAGPGERKVEARGSLWGLPPNRALQICPFFQENGGGGPTKPVGLPSGPEVQRPA